MKSRCSLFAVQFCLSLSNADGPIIILTRSPLRRTLSPVVTRPQLGENSPTFTSSSPCHQLTSPACMVVSWAPDIVSASDRSHQSIQSRRWTYQLGIVFAQCDKTGSRGSCLPSRPTYIIYSLGFSDLSIDTRISTCVYVILNAYTYISAGCELVTILAARAVT